MFEDIVKKLDIWDIALIKLAVGAFVLAAITYIPALMTWVHDTNIGYIFFWQQ